jgi:hypothetical protein
MKKSLTNILFQEVLNTGVVITLVSFDPTGLVNSLALKPENVKLRRLTFNWFESDWYFDVGKVICIALNMSCFTANLIDILKYTIIAFKRYADRSFKNDLKKHPLDEDDD